MAANSGSAINNPGLSATLAIPARAGASDRLAAQTPDVPQKVA